MSTAANDPHEAELCRQFAEAHAGQLVDLCDKPGVRTRAMLWGYVVTKLGLSGIVVETDVKRYHALNEHNRPLVKFTTDEAPGESVRLIGLYRSAVMPLEPPLAPKAQKKDDSRFPHVCPRCGSPAYIGFASTECSKAGCT